MKNPSQKCVVKENLAQEANDEKRYHGVNDNKVPGRTDEI